MNKAILSLLLAVCILGMALIMLNDRLRRPDAVPQPAGVTAPAADQAPLPPLSPATPQDPAREAAPQEALAPTPQPALKADAAAPLPEPLPAPSTAPLPPPAPSDRPTAAADQAPRPHAPEAQAPEAPKPSPAAAAPKPAAPAVVQAAPTPAVKAAPRQQVISRFVIFARETGATVRLVGNGPLSYKSMQLAGPDRVVVDLEGQWQVKAPGVPKNPLVTNVRIGKSGDKTRVVIDLSGKPKKTRYTLSKDRRMLDIRVD